MRLRFIGILAVLAIMALAATPVAAEGNAGTIKVDGEEFDTTPGNEPHVDCVFDIDFYGFPLDATADVLFEAVAPTSPTGTVFTQTGLDIGDDAAGGGTDEDGSFVFDLSDELSGFEPHDQQGYHVRLTVTTTVPDQPADVKHKVFWIEPCAIPTSPTLLLEKVVTGTGASTTMPFSFTVNGGTAFNLTAADPALQVGAAAGQYTILEGALPAGWSLSSITCDSDIAPVVDTTARSVMVTVGADEDVTCTFSNAFLQVSADTPTLSLDKVVTSGNANVGFSFTLNGAALANPISASQPALLVSQTAGTYTIVELAQSGWNLASIDCTGNAMAETVNTAMRTVTVTVGADEDVVCTFTNGPSGTLGGNPPSPPPPATPVGSGTLPNTAMEKGPADQAPTLVLGLVALAGSAFVARRNIAAIKQRG